MNKKRTVIKGVAIGIVVLLALLVALTGFITDLLWFKEQSESLVYKIYEIERKLNSY